MAKIHTCQNILKTVIAHSGNLGRIWIRFVLSSFIFGINELFGVRIWPNLVSEFGFGWKKTNFKLDRLWPNYLFEIRCSVLGCKICWKCLFKIFLSLANKKINILGQLGENVLFLIPYSGWSAYKLTFLQDSVIVQTVSWVVLVELKKDGPHLSWPNMQVNKVLFK